MKNAARISLAYDSLLVVLEADFELANRFVGRAQSVGAMPAEIVGRMLDVFPRVAQRFESVMDFGMPFRGSRERGWRNRFATGWRCWS